MYGFLTIVCEDALRSDHLVADMTDNQIKILQCWKLAVEKHVCKRHKEQKPKLRQQDKKYHGMEETQEPTQSEMNLTLQS